MKRSILLLFLFIPALFFGQGLRTQGKDIVDHEGNEVILKGIGFGGWMLMEGYMMQSSDVADTQHEFRERLVELMGEDKTDQFFDAWLANHATRADVDSMASWGYNSIRLPMHYNLFTLPIEDEPVAGENTWLTKGFDMVDSLLYWCEQNSMYLILDLHAAPGGQGYNAAISDYDPDKPRTPLVFGARGRGRGQGMGQSMGRGRGLSQPPLNSLERAISTFNHNETVQEMNVEPTFDLSSIDDFPSLGN